MLCAGQAGALVHIYTDGTVLLTHGGVEMGQVPPYAVYLHRAAFTRTTTSIVMHEGNVLGRTAKHMVVQILLGSKDAHVTCGPRT